MTPDTVRDPFSGPDQILSTEHPPTRGDWHTLATLACRALKIKVPENRYEATLASARIKQHIDQTGGAAS